MGLMFWGRGDGLGGSVVGEGGEVVKVELLCSVCFFHLCVQFLCLCLRFPHLVYCHLSLFRVLYLCVYRRVSV